MKIFKSPSKWTHIYWSLCWERILPIKNFHQTIASLRILAIIPFTLSPQRQLRLEIKNIRSYLLVSRLGKILNLR
jgi:hypothetical protein